MERFLRLHRRAALVSPVEGTKRTAGTRIMGFTGIAVGSLMGLTTKLGSNALQKLPYMRQPWEHVLFIGIGAYTGNYLEKKYHRDVEEVEALRLYLERRPDITRKD